MQRISQIAPTPVAGAAPEDRAPSQTNRLPTQKNDRVERSSPSAAGGKLLENAAIGIDAHRMISHRYEMRPIETKIDGRGNARNTSVAGILDTHANIDAKTGIARGAFEVRFDRAHNIGARMEGPHVNLGTGEHRAISVPSAVVESSRPVAQALEGLDRVAVPVGVAIDGARLATAFVADGSHVGNHTLHTAASVAGGWAGALAGAAGGAELGAFAGTVGGPPGMAIGGVAGGLIGGALGSFGVSIAAEAVTDRFLK